MSHGIYASCAAALDALNNGPGDFCHDYDTIREVVMCDAWQRMKTGQVSDFKMAVDAAWADTKSTCAPDGGITPEARESVPTVAQVYPVMDDQHQSAGQIVVEDDGSMTVCAKDRCQTLWQEPSQANRQAILDALRQIYPTVGLSVSEVPS